MVLVDRRPVYVHVRAYAHLLAHCFERGKVRVYCVGEVNDLVITVIYTDREPDERRIISAWKAEPQERRAYFRERHGGRS